MQNRYIAISCDVLFREVCLCASKSKNIVDVIFKNKGLHDIGTARMSEELQIVIDQLDYTKYDAILLGYGLCNNGIANLCAPIPIVVPRAHDCITLLLGSKEKYADYFAANPGTYYYSSGWLERSTNETGEGVMKQLGIEKTYEEYIDEYGEENAEYLMSILGNWVANYTKVTFINNGVGDIESNRARSKTRAESSNWEYEEIEGNISLIERLLDGEWNEADFLVIPPNHKIMPSNDEGIISYRQLS